MDSIRFRQSGTGNVGAPFSGAALDAKNLTCASVISAITVGAPTAKTFTVNTTDDQLSVSGHGYRTGLKVQVSTTTTLPSPLLAATDYYVIFYDSATIGLATSQANALSGAAIDLTTTGTGTHTITPTAFAGGALLIQGSNDNVNWVTVVTTAVSASGAFIASTEPVCTRYIRFRHEFTAGQITYDYSAIAKAQFEY